MREAILAATVEAGESFASDELAYLALTSRLERPFLDRLSFALHQRLQHDGLLVAREWPVPDPKLRISADIAVLRDSEVQAIVEGKAMHSFAPSLKSGKNVKFANRMQADLDRLQDAGIGNADIFCLLLATHPRSEIPDSVAAAVKYSKRINSCLASSGSEKAVRDAADLNLRSAVGSGLVIEAGAFKGGSAFGIPVDALWWLIGPFSSPLNLRLRAF